MEAKQLVYEYLDKQGIPYEVMEHKPVFTMEEMEEYGICEKGEVPKNLFLRDQNGKRHFLVVLQKDKKADLKALREKIGCTRLSFGSAERLQKYLGLTKGAVSPLGILNDEEQDVCVVIDKDLVGKERLGVHPNDNTATVWLSYHDLERIIKARGNDVLVIKI